MRCPNPVCRSQNSEEAWHCSRCGCSMTVEPGEIQHDQDRPDMATILTLGLALVAGLGVMIGTVYGMLPPAASDAA